MNYDVVLKKSAIDQNVLFIGFGVNYPRAGFAQLTDGTKNSSILGYAANDGVHPNEFIGNFVLQPLYNEDQVCFSCRIFTNSLASLDGHAQTHP